VELSGTSGAVLGTFGGCSSTNGTGTLLFDGAYIWVAGGASGGACKYKSSLFAPPLGLVGKYSVGGSVNQVAFDGINIWGTLGGTGVAKF